MQHADPDHHVDGGKHPVIEAAQVEPVAIQLTLRELARRVIVAGRVAAAAAVATQCAHGGGGLVDAPCHNASLHGHPSHRHCGGVADGEGTLNQVGDPVRLYGAQAQEEADHGDAQVSVVISVPQFQLEGARVDHPLSPLVEDERDRPDCEQVRWLQPEKGPVGAA